MPEITYVRPMNDGRAPLHTDLARIMAAVNAKLRSNQYCGSVIQVERVSDMPEADVFRIAESNQLVVTERYVAREGREVMGITRVIGTQPYLDHYSLHMLVRSWMMSQVYMLDFGPNHCDCWVGKTDDDWFRDQYVPSLTKRYGVDMPQKVG